MVLRKEFVHDRLNVEIVEIPYHKLVCSLSFFARTSDKLEYSWREFPRQNMYCEWNIVWQSMYWYSLLFVWWWFQLFTVYPGILYMYFQNIDLYISQNLLKTSTKVLYMFCHVLQQRLSLPKKFTEENIFFRPICLLSIKEILIFIFSSNCSYNAEHVKRFFKSWFYTERKRCLILHVFLNGECRVT